MKTRYGFLAALVLALGTFAGMADTIAILNTGVDNSGNLLPITPGATDPHWTITVGPNSPQPAALNYFSLVPGAWTISPSVNSPGTYTYEMTFNLGSGYDTVNLSASVWGASTVNAYLNGYSIGGYAGGLPPGILTDNNLAHFNVGGPNTLMLTVSSGGAVALAGTVTAVPEASEWAMLIGAAGLGLLYYRKQLVALTQREAPAAL